MSCIAVFNQKGGVGKTATALNLSAAINKNFKNPLLIDLDPQGHLTQILKDPSIAEQTNIYDFYKNNIPLVELEIVLPKVGGLIPSHRELLKVDTTMGKGPAILNKLRLGLERLQQVTRSRNIVIDCCPYIGVLSLNAIFAADLVIVPVASDYTSLESAKKVKRTLDALMPVLKKRIERRYLLTNFDRRTKMCFDVHEKLLEIFGNEVCKTIIFKNVSIAESTHHNQDVLTYSPESAGATNHIELRNELIEQQLISVT